MSTSCPSFFKVIVAPSILRLYFSSLLKLKRHGRFYFTKTLTFNLQYSGYFNEFDENIKDINAEIKDILKDCYDNEIIFDLGYDKILVISQLPMYKYFNLIENDKNVFYEVKVFSYDDNRYYKYIYKNKEDYDRNEYELLNDLDYDGK